MHKVQSSEQSGFYFLPVGMKQPFIYTLPEAFIEDKSVPLHWKLYALINGFWISGKPVFASNAFFADKLGCSERYIQDCLKKLEELKIVQRVGISQNRTIIPWGTNRQLVGGRTDSSKGGEPPAHHISDSISDSLTSADEPRIVNSSLEGEDTERVKKPPKYENARTVFSWFPKPQPSWKMNTTELKHAELLFMRGEEEVKKRLRFLKDHEGEDFLPTVTKPSDLERKWEDIRAYAKRNS